MLSALKSSGLSGSFTVLGFRVWVQGTGFGSQGLGLRFSTAPPVTVYIRGPIRAYM